MVFNCPCRACGHHTNAVLLCYWQYWQYSYWQTFNTNFLQALLLTAPSVLDHTPWVATPPRTGPAQPGPACPTMRRAADNAPRCAAQPTIMPAQLPLIAAPIPLPPSAARPPAYRRGKAAMARLVGRVERWARRRWAPRGLPLRCGAAVVAEPGTFPNVPVSVLACEIRKAAGGAFHT